jgi:hypothetical protein
MRLTHLLWILPVVVVSLVAAGCTIDLRLAGGSDNGSSSDGSSDSSADLPADSATDTGAVADLAGAVDEVQVVDPRGVALPGALVDAGDTIVIDSDVEVIINIEEDLPAVYLPDSTVLGFDNQTGYDLYLRFLADGELQGVYVYDGETLLLDYPCLDTVELLSEDDVDPPTGLVVDSYDLEGVFLNPDDFICGDALIVPFEPSGVEISVEYVDLLP